MSETSGIRSDVRVFHDENVVGTCGKCGGPIVVPIYWVSSVGNNEKIASYCKDCGRTPKKVMHPTWGPVIEMEE